ncbi:hypothetical protein BDK51DRAFT_38647 [Blyttiomyces helicus]|uniref:Uncharacterized protein n=1 Tax=Blyttiomyces helicus TaxID=388810 RepID=A0A4P9W4W0_9FUNG|nr:hypothetical protein BDK51DRAFT_38647 [Blyttiomyces helicus]|eukprot:RKO87401.1 hypothetical protein BDK51DRAFT_38647 [Blyttiomyces helicus]
MSSKNFLPAPPGSKPYDWLFGSNSEWPSTDKLPLSASFLSDVVVTAPRPQPPRLSVPLPLPPVPRSARARPTSRILPRCASPVADEPASWVRPRSGSDSFECPELVSASTASSPTSGSPPPSAAAPWSAESTALSPTSTSAPWSAASAPADLRSSGSARAPLQGSTRPPNSAPIRSPTSPSRPSKNFFLGLTMKRKHRRASFAVLSTSAPSSFPSAAYTPPPASSSTLPDRAPTFRRLVGAAKKDPKQRVVEEEAANRVSIGSVQEAVQWIPHEYDLDQRFWRPTGLCVVNASADEKDQEDSDEDDAEQEEVAASDSERVGDDDPLERPPLPPTPPGAEPTEPALPTPVPRAAPLKFVDRSSTLLEYREWEAHHTRTHSPLHTATLPLRTHRTIQPTPQRPPYPAKKWFSLPRIFPSSRRSRTSDIGSASDIPVAAEHLSASYDPVAVAAEGKSAWIGRADEAEDADRVEDEEWQVGSHDGVEGVRGRALGTLRRLVNWRLGAKAW